MDYLYSIIFGIIQGVTEFLPISSSGHLFLAHQWLNFDLTDNLAFDVALHFGTLIALVIFFFKDICRLLKAFVDSLCSWKVKTDNDQRLVWLIILGIIPAGLVGFFWEDWLEKNFYSAVSVASMLILVGILMLVIEYLAKKKDDLNQLDTSKALTIGLGQSLALIPGVSRSGITIITGMAVGLKREAAARFSFLLALPLVAAAAAKKFLDLINLNGQSLEWGLFLTGVLTAAGVGFLSIKFLLKFLNQHRLNIFAYYRIILGLIILGWFIF